MPIAHGGPGWGSAVSPPRHFHLTGRCALEGPLGYDPDPGSREEADMSVTQLGTALAGVRERIARNAGRGLNEQNTKATLIEPVLRALGWDTEDVEEVVREYTGKRQRKPVDYGLLTRRAPRLLVEAKPLGATLTDNKWANQIMGYASVAGVKWMVLTNGDEYRIYNTHAPVPIDQKLWRSVKVSENTPIVVETLELLARDRLDENRIDALWQAHFVDRKVKQAIKALFEGDNDKPLVTMIRKLAADLSPSEIRASLRRCQLTLDFPATPRLQSPPSAGPGRPAKAEARPASKRTRPPAPRGKAYSDVTVRQLLDAGLLTAPVALVRRYKGVDLSATICHDGRIEFAGEAYDSPSQAGSFARASVIGPRPGGGPPATNGWTFWMLEGPGGEWVELAGIRSQYEASRRGG